MTAQQDQFVYIIATVKDGEPCAPIKVGVTGNLTSRLRGLQTASAYELTLFHYFVMPQRDMVEYLETAFHKIMEAKRLRGEWFDMPPLEATHIMCLNIEVLAHTIGRFSDEDRETFLRLTRVKDAVGLAA